MEKLGVVTEEQQDGQRKQGSAAMYCPECGKPLDRSTNVKKCPAHGTEPFEPKHS